MIRCPGCNRGFTHHGLSQHISKTRRASCQNLHLSLQTQTAFQRTPHATSSLAPNTSSESRHAADVPIGGQPAREDDRNSTDSSRSSSQDHADPTTLGADEGKFSRHTMRCTIDTCMTDGIDDPVDTADANTFEIISGTMIFSPVATPEPELVGRPPSSSPPPEDAQPSIPEAPDQEPQARLTWVIDRFPHGHPGAPLSDTSQGSSGVYESTHNELGDSVWAPFRSQCDWEFARWAKTCRASALAVTTLLAIPEVWAHPFPLSIADVVVLEAR